MTNDVRFEKGALWVGEKRSGKSTLVWIQEQLVGSAAYASLSFHDWTKTENSRAHLVGKKVAVFPDVRLKPPKNFGLTGYDPGGLDHQSAQILLQIIGRDTVAIGRKNKEAWQGRLSTKIIITTNELLNLQDAGGVLITRFIVLEFKQSFFGREDVNLREKLEAELPGIANRCLTAYRRLRERGRFIQPKAGLGLLQRIEEKIDPYVAFMRDCWVEDPTAEGVIAQDFLPMVSGQQPARSQCKGDEAKPNQRSEQDRAVEKPPRDPPARRQTPLPRHQSTSGGGLNRSILV